MANRMNINKDMADSMRFLKMPISTQALYFHLVIRSGNYGVVGASKIMKLLGSSKYDLNILAHEKFIEVQDGDFVLINNWDIRNEKEMRNEL